LTGGVDVCPVPLFVMVTFAPDTAPPFWSRIVPWMLPVDVVAWPCAGDTPTMPITARMNAQNGILIIDTNLRVDVDTMIVFPPRCRRSDGRCHLCSKESGQAPAKSQGLHSEHRSTRPRPTPSAALIDQSPASCKT